VKSNSKPKRLARPEDIARLAKKIKWRDIRLADGGVVTRQTTRQIFEDAAKALKWPKMSR